MKWARYRFLKVTGPQKWRWEHFPDKMDNESIDDHYEEMCSEEGAKYERGARIEWEIGEIPPKNILENESKRLREKAFLLMTQAVEIDRTLQKGKFMSEEQIEKLNSGARG